MRRLKLLACWSAVIVLALTGGIFEFPAATAHALTAADWHAGSIIDDSVFYNSGSMSEAQIQNFLNSKVPVCDNWGTQPYAGTTRRAYSEARGISFPLVCLKDYFENPVSHENNLNGTLPVGSKSAARLIWEVAQTYSINPQVILTLLQKEQGLVLDDWPWPSEYRAATGYGCPDTAPCDSQYYGFYNQISNAAHQFRNYAASPNSFNYLPAANNNIAYNPNGACGGSNVFISNQVTASLYNYTPYQPNAAALANLYGTGDGCSAYGNRNFWRVFNDWFGSSAGPPISGPIYRMHNPYTNDWLYTLSDVEREAAGRIGGYILDDGVAFSGYPENTSGVVPVYRLQRNGIHLYTSDQSEVNVAVNQVGYTNEGIRFYAKTASGTDARPVYRLSNNSRYFYTVNDFERSDMANRGYTQEGTPFYLSSQSAKVPVYRMSRAGEHLFTTAAQERDGASTVGYRFDGIVFSAQSAVTSDALPVYRLERRGQYLFTLDRGERDAAVLLYGYRSEGAGFFGYPANYLTTTPVYRLANPRPEDHIYVTSPEEVNVDTAFYGYHSEFIGFDE